MHEKLSQTVLREHQAAALQTH